MNRNTYPAEFKEQALSKARERGSKTLQNIADELNLSLGTLKNWLKESAPTQGLVLPTNTPRTTWSAAQRLGALLESHALKDQTLHAWCREKGLFEHQLRQWQVEFCKIDRPSATPADAALRQAKQKNDQLERELRRKDKALAVKNSDIACRLAVTGERRDLARTCRRAIAHERQHWPNCVNSRYGRFPSGAAVRRAF